MAGGRGGRGRFLTAALLAASLAALLLAGCGRDREDPFALPPVKPHPVSGTEWVLVTEGFGAEYRGPSLGTGIVAQRFGWAGWGMERRHEEERRIFYLEHDPAPAFVAGLYVDENLTPVPPAALLRLRVGDAVYGEREEAVRNYRQELNLREGILATRADWASPRGEIRLAVKGAALLARPHLVAVRLEVDNRSSAPLEVTAPLPEFEAPWEPVTGTSLAAPELPPGAQLSWRVARAPDDGVTVATATLLLPLGEATASAGPAAAGERHGMTLEVPAGREGAALRLTAITTSREAEEPLAAAAREVAAAANAGWERLREEQVAAWAEAWKADIEVEGDLEAQQLLRAAWFALRGSVHPDRADGVPPMGLTSTEFNGHVFWDMDTWVFPAVLLQAPELARAMLEYRYRTLPGARENAAAEGRQGASFAWESGVTGRETQTQLDMRHGRHVNGCIALAAWHYWLATQDRAWLRTRGWPLLRETADYWVSRAERADDGHYTFFGVMTPDETAGLVDDSAWTAHVARLNLLKARRAAALLGEPAAPEWEKVAAGLRMPRHPDTDLYLPYAGYTGVPAKQADLLLIFYPGGLRTTPEELAAHYDHYADRVSEVGPAMTDAIHAVLAARLGRTEEAERRFRASYRPFTRPPYYTFSEKRTRDNSNFLTGLGGTLQAAVYGLAGLEVQDGDLPAVEPRLPAGWSALRLRGIRWRGSVYDLELKPGAEPVWREGVE